MVYLAMAPIAIEKKNLTLHIKIVVGVTEQASLRKQAAKQKSLRAMNIYGSSCVDRCLS